MCNYKGTCATGRTLISEAALRLSERCSELNARATSASALELYQANRDLQVVALNELTAEHGDNLTLFAADRLIACSRATLAQTTRNFETMAELPLDCLDK